MFAFLKKLFKKQIQPKPLSYKEQIEKNAIEALKDVENWEVDEIYGKNVYFVNKKIGNLCFRFFDCQFRDLRYDVEINNVELNIPYKYKHQFYKNIGFHLFEKEMEKISKKLTSKIE